MANILYKGFFEYLKNKGIYQTGTFSDIASNNGSISEEKAVCQLELISQFHVLTMGYEGYMDNRLENSTGKLVEQYKVYLKKAKRDLRKVGEMGPKNNYESLFLARGEEFIQRAEACIRQLYESDYFGLISRSMKRIEVCLGDTGHNNLRKNGHIEVAELKHCSYDMVECDGLYYLNKLKKIGVELDWKELIKQFCIFEGLNLNSEKFLTAMFSYPYDFMKCSDRYRYRKKDWSDDEYEARLVKAIAKEGDSLIDF